MEVGEHLGANDHNIVCACMRACVRVPCCDFQYGHHLEIGLRQGAEGLRPLCGAIFF